ncbi:MAG: zf-HC2 domain-containing protein [Erysipelotrichaceae bacterium]
MNKQNCSIVSDVLPLYVEGVLHEQTTQFVADHLEQCETCRQEWRILKEEPPVYNSNAHEIEGMKALRNKIKGNRIKTGVFAALISCIVVILTFVYLSAPIYLSYDQMKDQILIQEKMGLIVLHFEGEYEIDQRADHVYDLSLYTTVWNKLTHNTKEQTILVNPDGERVSTLYYVSNGEDVDQVLYGANPNAGGGVVTLPRLVLRYYFAVAMVSFVCLGSAWLLFRKNEKMNQLLWKCSLAPLSYVSSHLLIKGLNGATYAALRDFSLILLLAIPIYALLFVVVKKGQETI